MRKIFIPLLAFLIVGCSGTKINKEGEEELKESILDFTELLEKQGKDACKSGRYEIIPLQLEQLNLENKVDGKGYISKKTEEVAKKLVKYCSVWNFLE
tara:strand:- start:110 stop:403 length:294 start_codon:yes stop_codon:yes gene_type:complete